MNNNNIDKLDNLTRYGQNYQTKVITCLIYDEKFLSQIYDILHEKFFESEANQWIVEKTKEYFKQYKTAPTLEVFKTKIEEENNEVFQNSIVKKLRESFDEKDSNDLQYIKDNFVEFCINQNYKLTVFDSIDLIKSGQYDELKLRFKHAFTVGQNRDMGLFLLDESVESMMDEAKRNTIPTRWSIINDLTEGGIGDSETGELFVVVGAPGGGKTWTLCSVGASALQEGKTVVHFSLELGRRLVAKRYYSLFTDIKVIDLKFNMKDIEKRVNNLKNNNGKLIIKTYPPKKASLDTLHSFVNSLKNEGINPDLVIIDYADLLKPPKFFKDKRLEIGNIYEDMRGFSGELKVPVWTGSQSNREGGKSDIIEGEHISEDYSKIMICDFAMSVSRKKEDSEHKTARVFIIKNRFGADKMMFPATFNVDNGKLVIYESDSIEGKDLNKKMSGSDLKERKILKEKYFKDSNQ